MSELLPTGGGQNAVDFVASGTLSSGQTVALNSDGTVEAVAGTTTSVGSPVVFASTNTSTTAAVYDSNANKVVMTYVNNLNAQRGTAVVGTVSGTSITFGTPVVFETGAVTNISPVFDSTANKIVIAYRDLGNSSYGTAVVGTISGTSISFGSPVVFRSATSAYMSATYDSTNNVTVIAYWDGGNGSKGTAIVGTVSGTSISFGTSTVFEPAASDFIAATFDSTANKIVIAYDDNGNSGFGTAVVGTVSGTSISFGAPVVFNAADTAQVKAIYESTANKIVIIYY